MATPLSPSEGKSSNKRTEILYGVDNVIDIELQFFSNSNIKIDTCMNYTRPQLAIVLESIKKVFLDAKTRGIKLRYLTEITEDNISYCKKIMSIVDELRHLDGIKGSFMISESEYLAPIILFEKGKVASQIIHSNVTEIVEQQQYVFDTLWNKAVPAEHKIKEIEEGIEPVRTRLLENQGEIIREIKRKNNAAKKLSICTSIDGMQMSYNYLFDSYRNVVDNYKKVESKEGLRWLTSIDDKEAANLVKIFLQSEMQVRHIKNMPPLGFGVSDKEVAITVDKMVNGKISMSILTSNEPLYVDHFNSLFDELWNNAIDARQRIKDIEQMAETSDIEIVANPIEGMRRYWDLIRSAKQEVLIILSTANAFRRQLKMGVMKLFKEACIDHNVKVRMLIPAASDQQMMRTINELRVTYPQIVDFRIADESLRFRISIILIDRKNCIIIETKDDTADNSYDAMGLTTYSNGKSIVLSYASIFEGLWKQSELYEQLTVHNKMQKDFINIAAHELRTPIQPILGLSDFLLSKKGDIEQYKELLDAIKRSAERLHALTEDILDITKIESQSLDLKKEQFNLNDILTNIINDTLINFLKNKEKNVKLLYQPQDVFIVADKERLSQVFGNLLSNAIKFTNEGTITIIAQEKDNQVIVSVEDTGTGIDPEIIPKLFSKFASKSYQGTGLGLFISKSIVEAHGGKIWAENNKDGKKGATFYFSLPLSK